MSQLLKLRDRLLGQFPTLRMDIDEPEEVTGPTWLTIRPEGKLSVVIEYRPARGFGFYADDAAYGEGPDEIITDPEKAFEEAVGKLR